MKFKQAYSIEITVLTNIKGIKQCGTEIVDSNKMQEEWKMTRTLKIGRQGRDADLILYFLKSSMCDKNERVTSTKVCIFKHTNERSNY